jgi:hypothetical protein
MFSFRDFSKNGNQKNNSNQRTIEDSPYTSIKFNNNFEEDEEDAKSTITDEQQRSSRLLEKYFHLNNPMNFF